MSNDNNGPIVVRGCRVRVREGSGRRRRCHGQGRHVLTRSTENRSGTVSVDTRASQKLVRVAGGQARAPKRVQRKWDVKPATDAAMPAAPGGSMMSRGPILTGATLDASIGDGRARALGAHIGGTL